MSPFWDINTDDFNPHAYPQYTIGRILELGTDTAVTWMKATFSDDEIKNVIRGDRRLSPRSANYWALIYHITPEEVTALTNLPSSV
jgi:hypothetical protein